MSTNPFDGAVAIVTGGASGIGRAVGTMLAARGATVVLADINAAGAKSVAADIGAAGPGSAVAVTLDVTDADAVKTMVESTAAEHGRIDFLFNNAGIGAGGPVEQIGLDAWLEVIDVDVHSVIYGVAAAYPIMVRQESGHIVNTASLAGLIPAPLLTPYAAAKHAVVGLSMSLRVEAAARGVRVSAVCPGPVETPLLDSRGPVNARKLLTNSLGAPYPVESMAADILAGVAENRALIVAPESAREAWQLYRQDPDGILAVMSDRAASGRRRRAQEEPPSDDPAQAPTSVRSAPE